MNESVMRLWTLLTVVFAVSTTLWLAGMVQAQQAVGLDIVAAPSTHSVTLASAQASPRQRMAFNARSMQRAASAALEYADSLR